MFEKLFGKYKKRSNLNTTIDLEQPLAKTSIEESNLEQSSANSLNFEDDEKKEREHFEKINQEIQKLDKQIVLDVEKRIGFEDFINRIIYLIEPYSLNELQEMCGDVSIDLKMLQLIKNDFLNSDEREKTNE